MTDTFTFETATKAGAKARLALAGPTGSGKTYTALRIATAWGGTIGVIDTERGSASLYSDLFAFRRLNMQTYDPRDLPRALAAAASAGIDTVIIDSLSKFWSGEGGMLQQVDNAARRSYGGNSFGGWKEARPMEAALIEAMLAYPGHVIVTMRVKTEWVIDKDDRGRSTPRKVGLQPEQRQGIEYEFQVVGDMDQENNLVVTKTRCPALAGLVVNRPGEDFALTFLSWLEDGVPAPNANDFRERALDQSLSKADLLEMYREAERAGLLGAAFDDGADDTITLKQVIISAGKAAEAREAFGAAEQPDPTTPAGPAANGASTAGSTATPAASPSAEPEPAADPGDQWAADFRARLAGADEDGLRILQREIGSRMRSRKITAQEAGGLSDEIRARRAELLADVPA